MKERQIEMIKKILYNSSPLSIEELENSFSVSERTIKYDIADIRDELDKIDVEFINKKGLGYYFSPDAKPTLIDYFALSDSEDRLKDEQANLLMYTLFIDNPANISSIAEKLYFDSSTIKRFIEDIIIDEKNVMMKQLGNDKIEITGNEYEIRKFYTDIIIKSVEQTTGSEISTRLIEAFPNYEEAINMDWFLRVKDLTRSHLKTDKIWISEKSFEYLIVYLFVLYYRETGREVETLQTKDSTFTTKDEHNFANELLANLFWGKYTEREVQFLVRIMLENDIFSDGYLNNHIESELTTVITDMIDYLNENDISLKIDAENLARDLRPHLKQIIRKYKIGIDFERNPLLYQIKQKYKDHYEHAQNIYKIFCQAFDIDYSDDEASLIAIYLYKNTVNKGDEIFKAYLVCGSGRGFSKLLEQRLSNIFPNIIVLETLSSFYLLKKQNISEVDLIISTIELPELSVPVVKVTSFLGRRDIQLINQVLEYGTTTYSLSLATDDYDTENKISYVNDEITNLNKEQAKIFTSIFLEFYNILVNLPDEYEVNQDKLLGITIHLIIALPRYFENMDEDQDLVDEVANIEKNHKTLTREMNLFLNNIGTKLDVSIPYAERYALYQYILN